MSEARQILGKIAALRQRLEQACAAEAPPAVLEELARRVAAADEHDAALDHVVRPLVAAEAPPLPRQLTARARRVLELGRDQLAQLRHLADAFHPADGAPLVARDEPLARLYRETAAIIDAALRVVPLLPAPASAQLRVCEGLEAVLSDVARRLRILTSGVARARAEADRTEHLAGLLSDLAAGAAADFRSFLAVAEELIAEGAEGGPLSFSAADAAEPAHFVARHSLTVARVVARLVRHDPDLRGRPTEPVLAALIHDAGMLRVPPAVLADPGPLDDAGRRVLEGHCHAGADLAARLLPDAGWLADAVRTHHERLDGTGYPDGLYAHHLSSLARLLAVCDVYAALCADRPHRAACDPRTALTDTLLLAEQGRLDRRHAERLLHLSFYPVGSAVELADGSVGVVVAVPAPGRDVRDPARPVVAVLLDESGHPLPAPRHRDLLGADSPSVVRTLAAVERREVLGRDFVEWV